MGPKVAVVGRSHNVDGKFEYIKKWVVILDKNKSWMVI